MARWKRDNKAVLIKTIEELMSRGWENKQIAAHIGKTSERVRKLRQLILESARCKLCKSCGHPLKLEPVGTTVPCENVKPADV
jgi:predicted Zn-ribbon and HTH transcriptional regulator